MSSVYFGRAGGTPPVVKNLIILNSLMFLGMLAINSSFHYDLNRLLGLYYFKSPLFQPFQVITHMFMHGSISHIFFNMFALWMFGKVLEQVWGSRRFLTYYLITGLGAAILHMLVYHIEYASVFKEVSAAYNIDNFTKEVVDRLYNTQDPDAKKLAIAMIIPTVGASGAVFGLLLAFGMLFPNTSYVIVSTIILRENYFVIGYSVLELYLRLTQPGSNIAHFAHLGGMLFGFILIKFWQKKRNTLF